MEILATWFANTQDNNVKLRAAIRLISRVDLGRQAHAITKEPKRKMKIYIIANVVGK